MQISGALLRLIQLKCRPLTGIFSSRVAPFLHQISHNLQLTLDNKLLFSIIFCNLKGECSVWKLKKQVVSVLTNHRRSELHTSSHTKGMGWSSEDGVAGELSKE